MSDLERSEFVDELVAGLAAKGLAVVPVDLVAEALKFQKAKTKLMRRNQLTPYEISKFELLDGAPSLTTIKNMIEDGRILPTEVIDGKGGKRYIIKAAIERLNSL